MTELNISTILYVAETDLRLEVNEFEDIYNSLNVSDYQTTQNCIIMKNFKEKREGYTKKLKTVKRESKEKKSFRNQLNLYTSFEDTVMMKCSKFDKSYSNFSKTMSTFSDCDEVFSYTRGKSMIPFSKVSLVLNEDCKEGDIINVTSSSSRKTMNDYVTLRYTLRKEDIERKSCVIDFYRKYFIDGLFVKGKAVKSCKVHVHVETNTFIFRTGKLKIAGCLCEEHARKTFDIISKELRMSDYNMNLKALNIIMINSDFCLQHHIIPEFVEERIKEKNMLVSYDSIIHPAVNIKYMYNEKYKSNGLCKCCELYGNTYNCSGNQTKGSLCKMVTILIFTTGKVIITGSNDFHQLQEVYQFTKNFFHDNPGAFKNI